MQFWEIRSKEKNHHLSEAGVSFEIHFSLWIKIWAGEHIFYIRQQTIALKEYVQNRYNITLSLTITIKLIYFFFWITPLNSNFTLLADFPYMMPFQMPYLSELHYNSIYKYPVSIPFIYYSIICKF